jgi:hypothetical protein
MLKFEKLGKSTFLSNNAFKDLMLSEEPLKVDSVLTLSCGDSGESLSTVGVCRVRRAGTGHVAEGHFGPAKITTSNIANDKLVPSACTLELKVKTDVVLAAGSTTLNLKSMFPELTGDQIVASTGSTDAPANPNAVVTILDESGNVVTVGTQIKSVSNGVLTFENAPTVDTVYTLKFVAATGVGTVKNNAETVVLDEGIYQIHLVARLHDDIDATRMPNPTMLEFVKKCRTGSGVSA